MAKNDPPSPQLLELLHYVEDLSNFIHSRPKTTSDAARLLWFHIRRLRGMRVEWPLPQPGGIPGVRPQLLEVAGVTSLQPDALGVLTGAIRLLSGTNVTLSEAGQDITISAATGLSSLILFDSTLGADAASIDTGAGGIAQTAETLQVVITARTSEAVALSTVLIRCNNDSGANYDRTSVANTNATLLGSTTLAGTSWVMSCAGDSIQAGGCTIISMVIPSYRQTTFHKSATANGNVPDSVAANNRVETRGLRWRDTSAISRMAVLAGSGNLRAGSRLTVYGLR